MSTKEKFDVKLWSLEGQVLNPKNWTYNSDNSYTFDNNIEDEKLFKKIIKNYSCSVNVNKNTIELVGNKYNGAFHDLLFKNAKRS